MVTLEYPVVITISSPEGAIVKSHRYNGNLNYSIIDNPTQKTVKCKILATDRSVLLWSGQQYDTEGDYTQSKIDSTISGLLAPNAAAFLSTLFTGIVHGVNYVPSGSI